MDSEALFDHKVLLVTGKGGIGKTAIAATLALHALKLGKRVCLVESSVDDQISPLFSRPAIGHQLQELRPNLHTINLNAADNFRDFIVKHLGFAMLFDKVFTRQIVKNFIGALPAIAELTLLGRIYYMAKLQKDPAFDLVIYDGFASGHFLALLNTPQAVLDSSLIGPVIKETENIFHFFGDPRNAATVMVSAAEALVVSESLEFWPKIIATKLARPKALVINRVLDETALEKGLKTWEQIRSGQNMVFSQYVRQKLNRQKQALDQLQAGFKPYVKECDLFTLPDLIDLQPTDFQTALTMKAWKL